MALPTSSSHEPGTTRVLWVSNETPDRHGQGGQRRQFFQIQSLVRAGVAVDVITLTGHQSDRSVRALAPVRRVSLHLPGGIERPHRLRTAERVARRGGHDLVVVAHLESVGLLGTVGTPLAGRVLVDLHNVMSDWYDRLGERESSALYHEGEKDALGWAAAVSVCSETELGRLPSGGGAERLVLRHGVDPAEWAASGPAGAATEPVVGMFGSWDWRPNAAGLRWFLDAVWPRVRATVPEARCEIAGHGVDPGFRDREGVAVLGRVPDLQAFAVQTRAVAVPVLDGVGASVKFADSLATGRPVVATPDAASAQPGAPAEVTADADAWVAALVHWLTDPRAADEAGAAARRYALERLTWEQSTRPLVELAHRMHRAHRERVGAW